MASAHSRSNSRNGNLVFKEEKNDSSSQSISHSQGRKKFKNTIQDTLNHMRQDSQGIVPYQSKASLLNKNKNQLQKNTYLDSIGQGRWPISGRMKEMQKEERKSPKKVRKIKKKRKKSAPLFDKPNGNSLSSMAGNDYDNELNKLKYEGRH